MSTAISAEPKPSTQPDTELLEFLASFETASGQWHELDNELDRARVKKILPTSSSSPRPKEEAKQ